MLSTPQSFQAIQNGYADLGPVAPFLGEFPMMIWHVNDAWAPPKDAWASPLPFWLIVLGTAIATARQIASADPDRLPALSLADLAADEVRRIRDLPAGSAVEISALARRSGTPSFSET